MRLLALILMATFLQLKVTSAFAKTTDPEAMLNSIRDSRVKRICDLASQGAPSYFSEMLKETDFFMKWLSVVESMPNEMRIAFARELVGTSSGLEWVAQWTKMKERPETSGSDKVSQTFGRAVELWDNVEGALSGANAAEIQAWRAAVRNDEPGSSGSLGSIYSGFIEKTIAIASICVLSLPEQELKAMVSKWSVHQRKLGLVLLVPMTGLMLVTKSPHWNLLYVLHMLFPDNRVSAGIKGYFSLKSYGRVLRSMHYWVKQMQESGAQILTAVSSESLGVQMNRIRTEGISGLSKIDVARVGLSELWEIEGAAAKFGNREHDASFDQDALELHWRIQSFGLNALFESTDMAALANRLGAQAPDAQLYKDLVKALYQRHKTADALLMEFEKESYSRSSRANFLEEIPSAQALKPKAFPLVEYFNRPMYLVMTSGLEIKGTFRRAIADKTGHPAYAEFGGPISLLDRKDPLPGQGYKHTQQVGAYGAPIGRLQDEAVLEELSDAQLALQGITPGKRGKLEFQSGVIVAGVVKGVTRSVKTGRLLLITFENYQVTFKGEPLLQSKSGTYDMPVGAGIESIWNVAEFQ